jgi:membrane protease subunit HflK
VPKARGTASRLLQEADGYKQRVIANAEGESARFRQIVTEYNRAPAVTRQRMYLDTMQQILSSTTTVIVDQKSSGNLLFLPLDKLMQMSGASAPAQDAAASAQQPEVQPAPTGPDARTRDSFRNREREARP